MTDRGTLTLIGFMVKTRFLLPDQSKDDNKWWTLLKRDTSALTGKNEVKYFHNSKLNAA
jgi:hypothetical protein